MSDAPPPCEAKPRRRRRNTEAPEPVTVGTTCYLKSGSPRMTIVRIVDDVTVEVAWCRYDTGEMHRDTLPLVALRQDWK